VWFRNSEVLQVGLSQHWVCIARRPGAGQGAATVLEHIACENGLPANEPWRAPVDALSGWLTAQKHKNLEIKVVLSERFVRWQLLPWRAELSSLAEIQAYAEVRFRETFGKLAEGWNILPVALSPGRTAPACAVDQALLTALVDTCKEHGADLECVAPYFSSAFDTWRARLSGSTLWFGTVEQDICTLALIQDGNWTALQTQRSVSNWRGVLPAMVTQIGIASALEGPIAPIYLAGTLVPPLSTPDFAFSWLQPKHIAPTGASNLRLAQGV
jgi:hypothetical protein